MQTYILVALTFGASYFCCVFFCVLCIFYVQTGLRIHPAVTRLTVNCRPGVGSEKKILTDIVGYNFATRGLAIFMKHIRLTRGIGGPCIRIGAEQGPSNENVPLRECSFRNFET